MISAGVVSVLVLCAAITGCVRHSSAGAPVTVERAGAEGHPVPWVIRLKHGTSLPIFEVTGFDKAELEDLAKTKPSAHRWNELFAVYVVRKDTTEKLPILGDYRGDKETLYFAPRFPLTPGLQYDAVLNPSVLSRHCGEPTIRSSFQEPKPASTSAAVVQHVYPSTDKLPENQLKFYIHFSAPMSRGMAYKQIHLLDKSGKAVDSPFLELDEELWDREGKRFTLFFDPGRIKRGLKPREEVGPALEEGKSYTLVVDRGWEDANGLPLKDSYRKAFRVGPPDDQPIDLKTWKIEPPRAGSKGPVAVIFPKPLDHALLERVLRVADSGGHPIAGAVATAAEETRWTFRPARPWPAGAYELVVGNELEDLAGNRIGRPFEVDVFHPIERELKAKSVKVKFTISNEVARPDR